MQIDNFKEQHTGTDLSYGEVLREVGRSTKDLLHSEVKLLTSELKKIAQDLALHAAHLVSF